MVEHTTLVEQLKALGIPEGKPLMVHASLRRVGPIAGGADTLLAALLQTIAPQGTLLMILGADEDEPFDNT
jgi:aminoglycoside 3-N-acetyltransferase